MSIGIGPVRFYSRGSSSSPEDDAIVIMILVGAGLAVLFLAAPWLAVHSLDGHWGVVPRILGVAYILWSAASMFVGYLGSVFVPLWILYGLVILGYPVGATFLVACWATHLNWKPHNFDQWTVAILAGAGATIEALVLLIIPIMAAWYVTHRACKWLVGRGWSWIGKAA